MFGNLEKIPCNCLTLITLHSLHNQTMIIVCSHCIWREGKYLVFVHILRSNLGSDKVLSDLTSFITKWVPWGYEKELDTKIEALIHIFTLARINLPSLPLTLLFSAFYVQTLAPSLVFISWYKGWGEYLAINLIAHAIFTFILLNARIHQKIYLLLCERKLMNSVLVRKI